METLGLDPLDLAEDKIGNLRVKMRQMLQLEGYKKDYI